MDQVTLILFLSLGGSLFLAFSMGANDVSNAMAPAVGAKAISIRQAVIIAAVLNCVGAIFLGSQVTATISTGIIPPSAIPDEKLLMIGMFSALLSSGFFVLLATFTGLPVSTTHALVGSLVGLGLVLGGPSAMNWKNLGIIFACWFLAPVFSALLGFVVFAHIRKTILYSRQMLVQAQRWIPWWVALTLALILLSFLYKTPFGKRLDLHFIWVGVIIAVVFLVVFLASKKFFPIFLRTERKPSKHVEELFRRMQLFTACFQSLSSGANDVSNAIGPVVTIYFIAKKYDTAGEMEIPTWILLIGGLGIALGAMTLGKRVMTTVGSRLIKMNNSRGFSVSFSSATTVLMATNFGIPLSTTHATIGSIVGVGLARGFGSVDFRVLGKIVSYWIITIPVSGFCCIGIYLFLRWIFIG